MNYLSLLVQLVLASLGIVVTFAWFYCGGNPVPLTWWQQTAQLLGIGYSLWNAFKLLLAVVMLIDLWVKLREARQLREQVRSQRLRKARS